MVTGIGVQMEEKKHDIIIIIIMVIFKCYLSRKNINK